MGKLWDKGYELNKVVERFTVGDDYRLDLELVRWDCVGSIAHAAMLAKIGILTRDESERLRKRLVEIVALHARDEFRILPAEEDVHTAVEGDLTKRLGEVGKKLHTARSRNDQVLLDLRLYMRDKLLTLFELACDMGGLLADFAEKHKDVPIVGRTHYQRAMPSSVGLWAGAFAESLLDDLALLRAAYQVADQCPLGSAASYGVNLDIDRQMVSDLLGFARVQNNVLYANNSRGKVEAIALSALSQIMLDLSKMANDIIFWSMPEFGYFVLPQDLCGGSSLMPQKRNPALFELTRAKTAVVIACHFAGDGDHPAADQRLPPRLPGDEAAADDRDWRSPRRAAGLRARPVEALGGREALRRRVHAGGLRHRPRARHGQRRRAFPRRLQAGGAFAREDGDGGPAREHPQEDASRRDGEPGAGPRAQAPGRGARLAEPGARGLGSGHRKAAQVSGLGAQL